MLEKIFTSIKIFYCVLCYVFNRNAVLRGQTEPTSVQWPQLLFPIEADRSSKFYGIEKLLLDNLGRKNNQLLLGNPLQGSEEHTPDALASNEDLLRAAKLLKTRRTMCHPNQIYIFCESMK